MEAFKKRAEEGVRGVQGQAIRKKAEVAAHWPQLLLLCLYLVKHMEVFITTG